MGLFSASHPPIDPRAPYEALNDLLALFKVDPLLKRLSFDTHWRGWHDERPPSNPRMMFWTSAWVGHGDVQSPEGIAMAQAVERVFIDRGLMVEPDEGYNWTGRNTLQSPWKRKDMVKAFEQEAKTPLSDPNRLALLRTQAMLEYLNGAAITRDTLDYRRDTIVKLMDDLVSVPEVPVDPPNAPSPAILHLRRKLHALRGDPVLERLNAPAVPADQVAADQEAEALGEVGVTLSRGLRRPRR